MNVGKHLMPLINVDVKSLELVVAAQLSGDKVMRQELLDKVDLHSVNQEVFKLGSGKEGRLVAKVLSFRIIYGGGGFSFARDPDFMGVSTSQKFWEETIEAWYAKYTGIANWHKQLIREAQENGKLTIPSGRYYPISPDYSKQQPWPLTIIKNYPVQGFGADLVMLARLRCAQLLREAGLPVLLIGTIHDSIVADTPTEHVRAVAAIMKQAVEEVPGYCKKVWGYDFQLPLTSEISFGPTKYNQKTLDI